MSDRLPSEWPQWLRTESEGWVRSGLIQPDQQVAILGLYPTSAAVKRDRTVVVLSLLGSLLLGAGVLLFIASNWAKIPDLFRVAMIFGMIVGAYWGGYQFAIVRSDYPRIGHGLILLGNLLYGGGIWLIAQIFHLESHYPTGFLLWGAGVLPMVWVARSQPALYLSTVLLIIWTCMEQLDFGYYNLLFPALMLGAVLPLARWLKSAAAEAALLGSLFLWFLLVIGSHGKVDGYEVEVVARAALLYGLALYLVGAASREANRAFTGVGTVIGLGGVYILSFSKLFGRTETGAMPTVFSGSTALLAGVCAIFALMLYGGWRIWRSGDPYRIPILTGAALILGLGLSFQMMESVPRMIAFNLALFGGTVGTVLLGIQRRSAVLLNLGLLIFVIHLLTRYLDMFFEAKDKSLFFIFGGILLIGGGYLLERNRRRWMADWGGNSHAG